MVGDAVFEGGKEGKVGVESDDIPRIDQRTALDAALEQIDCLIEEFGCLVQLFLVDRPLGRHEVTVDPAPNARRRDGHLVSFVHGRLNEPHFSV